MKVQITPCPLLNPGTAERLLAELGVGPMLVDPQGRLRCQMTEQQRDLFRLRGAAHALEVLPEVAAPSVPIPTLEEVVAAGYPAEAAPRIIERQQQLADAVARGEITLPPEPEGDEPDPEEPPAA